MMPKLSPEMQKLIKLFAGIWSKVGRIEPNEFLPKGGTGTGIETSSAGPGRNSVIGHYRSKGPMVAVVGHNMTYWDAKRQVYSSISCESRLAEGCAVATGKWEGDNLVFSSEAEMMGKKYQTKQVSTDIKPDSYTFYIDISTDGAPMKRATTVKYTRKAGAKTAAGPAKP